MENETITISLKKYEELIRESVKNQILLNMAKADKYISGGYVMLLLAGTDEILKAEEEEDE